MGAGVKAVGQGGIDVEGCVDCHALEFGDGRWIRVGDHRDLSAAGEAVFNACFEQSVGAG